MNTVLVTGSEGFIGRNLIAALQQSCECNLLTFNSRDDQDVLPDHISKADLIFHLAGVNRPRDEREYDRVNSGLTKKIVELLIQGGRNTSIVFSSSIHAEQDNAYGRSKRSGEKHLQTLSESSRCPVSIYRLPNVFGKWSKPKYNSVVADFCHQIARDQPVTITDPRRELHLVYIDEVIRCFLQHMDLNFRTPFFAEIGESFQIRLDQLAATLQEIHEIRKTNVVPDLSQPLTHYLYSTYLSFLPTDQLAHPVEPKTDARGRLFELIKSREFGQIFVSETKPGVIRGNHYHNTKIEKFCLIKGQGVIRFRMVNKPEILEYPVDDQQFKIVDIPPGFTHSIENTGSESMIVLFWASEIFDPNNPDTNYDPVINS